jgi:hypothetical protein
MQRQKKLLKIKEIKKLEARRQEIESEEMNEKRFKICKNK